MAAVVWRRGVLVWVLVVVSVVFRGCKVARLGGCKVASLTTFKAYLCTSFVGV